MNKQDYRVIRIEDEEYPDNLREIQRPPEQLYCIGDVSLLKSINVAVVGSRKFTGYGREVARLVGRELSKAGISVVSGLAFGIDAFAHEGALQAGGKPIAVLGTGFNHLYPACNEELFRRVAEKGLVISEYPPDTHGTKYTFPMRNRIISGISRAVIVVEARLRSGSLITANIALEQGRTVYAVPGNINSQFSAGTNRLIHDGAVPMIYIRDVIEDVGAEVPEETAKIADLGKDEREAAEAVMRNDGLTVNELCRILGRKPGPVNAIITVLEIKGIVHSYAGKIYFEK